MQPVIATNVSLSSQVPYGDAVAEMLPKNGEAAADALFSPIEETAQSGIIRTAREDYEPLVYDKPKVFARADEAQEQDEQDHKHALNSPTGQTLDEEELAQLKELKSRDQEVRAHEQAHKSAGGEHAGAVSFTYQNGPDGARYAVGGEVAIDISKVQNDPEATIEKMAKIQRAALAPAEPSNQDRQVAAQAGQIANQAMTELTKEAQEQREREHQIAKIKREKVELEKEEAKAKQKRAEEKEQENEHVSLSERFAEYNAKLRRLNEVLLELSRPQPVDLGQILNISA